MAARKRTALFDKPVPADDVVIRAVRLGDAIGTRMAAFFKAHGLTTLQYNVLRILYVRDAEGAGLPVGDIRGRLMVRVPDVTRLIDRLEAQELIERFRLPDDRRVVKVKLTAKGAALVERVHHPLIAHNQEMLAGMSRRDLERLAVLLARALEALD